MSTKASQAADAHLTATHGAHLKGWIFHVRKNGRVLVDAPHGMARRIAAAGQPARPYDSETLVHIASISKLICAVGVLRFIEDWNEIADHLDGFDYKGPARDPFDAGLVKAVGHWGGRIGLDDKIFPFLRPHLGWTDAGRAVRPAVTGLGVASITIRELLCHRSGLRDAFYSDGLTALGLSWDSVKQEVTPSGKARFDLRKDCAVVCANDVVFKREWYCNDGYTLLGALIDFNAARYEDWIGRKLLNHARFRDIARHPVDKARAARYFVTADGAAAPGVAHPDYADFSAAGGYYTSARAICDWLDAVMQAEPIDGRPILRNPQILQDMHLGVGAYDYGPYTGFDKNGGARVGEATSDRNGGTNARVVFLRSISGERLTAFVETNEADADGAQHFTDANPLLDDALAGIRAFAFEPTTSVLSPVIPLGQAGLVAHRWVKPATGGGATSSSSTVHPAIEAVANGAGRTNMLAGADIDVGAVQVVRLSGKIELPPGDYKLRLTSDDGSILELDGEVVIDNGERHGMASLESGWIAFAAGGKALTLLWYNVGGGAGCYLETIRKVGSVEIAAPVPPEAFHVPHAVPFSPPPVPHLPLQPSPLAPVAAPIP